MAFRGLDRAHYLYWFRANAWLYRLGFFRFLNRYQFVRRQSRELQRSSTSQQNHETLIVDLRRDLTTLKGIACASPFLGSAGTAYGILCALFFGGSMSRATLLAVISARIAAALAPSAAGILVAIPSIVIYNLLGSRLADLYDSSQSKGKVTPVDLGSFQFAQTSPLRKRISGFPPFAVAAAPVLACVITLFMPFHPYRIPTGLHVRVMPIGPLKGDITTELIVVSVVANPTGRPVVRLNCRDASNDLEKTLGRKTKLLAEPQVYVEADGQLTWGDVTNVIDRIASVPSNVVLLTTLPARDTKCSWSRQPQNSHCRP